MNTTLSGAGHFTSHDRRVYNPFIAPAPLSVPHRTQRIFITSCRSPVDRALSSARNQREKIYGTRSIHRCNSYRGGRSKPAQTYGTEVCCSPGRWSTVPG